MTNIHAEEIEEDLDENMSNRINILQTNAYPDIISNSNHQQIKESQRLDN